MYNTLQQCQIQLDSIQSIDYFLARQICQSLNREQDQLLFHSIMATSQALRNGHTCLKLDEKAHTNNTIVYWQNLEEKKSGYQFPMLDEWHKHLSTIAISPEENQPLVYEQQRLYLRRYWQFEQELSTAIRTLVKQNIPLDKIQAHHVIEQLFPLSLQSLQSSKKTVIDWQKIAVANALIQQFTIIAGGPGTGKTFTVTKILAALQSLSDNNLRIAMVAPTGKAAQRLMESIQNAKGDLQKDTLISEQTLKNIPNTASTLHRLLGVIPGTHNFRYNENRQLPFDVILVDEISMIDLPLMTRLIRAIDQNCRIIMLGDADQLPSVSAGSVLADLAPRQAAGYSIASSSLLNELTGCDIPQLKQKQCSDSPGADCLVLDHLTVLQKSYRFDGSGEIGQLAKQVIAGDAQQSWNFLAQAKEQIEHITTASFYHWIEQMVDQYYVPLFEQQKNNPADTIDFIFSQLNKFRFLAATRLGEQGVTIINDIIEQYLRKKGFISSNNEFYPGRPIMVTENHYNIGLYNGDTGILWLNEQGKLQAVFADKDSYRWLSLGRLPKVETVYAMTIHKTQGSEFTHVALVLPEVDSLILSRELLYTGITRAREKLSIWGNRVVWNVGVCRKVQRNSGLRDKVFKLFR